MRLSLPKRPLSRACPAGRRFNRELLGRPSPPFRPFRGRRAQQQHAARRRWFRSRRFDTKASPAAEARRSKERERCGLFQACDARLFSAPWASAVVRGPPRFTGRRDSGHVRCRLAVVEEGAGAEVLPRTRIPIRQSGFAFRVHRTTVRARQTDSGARSSASSRHVRHYGLVREAGPTWRCTLPPRAAAEFWFSAIGAGRSMTLFARDSRSTPETGSARLSIRRGAVSGIDSRPFPVFSLQTMDGYVRGRRRSRPRLNMALLSLFRAGLGARALPALGI